MGRSHSRSGPCDGSELGSSTTSGPVQWPGSWP
jgi:hypothetical protein